MFDLDSLNLTPAGKKILIQESLWDADVLGSAQPHHITELGLPVGDRVRLERVFPNLTPVQGQAPVRTNNILAHTQDLKEVFGMVFLRLERGDVSQDLLDLAATVGIREIVVDADGKYCRLPSERFALHLKDQRPKPSSNLWEDMRIVSLQDYARTKTVRVDPLSGKPLQNGKSEDTEIPWSTLPVDRVALVVIAAEDGLIKGMSDQDVFDAFRDPTHKLVQRTIQRMSAKGITLASAERLVTGATPTRQTQTSSAPTFRNANGALYWVFLNLFKEGREIHRFLEVDCGFTSSNIAGGTASLASVVGDAACEVVRHGIVDSSFWMALRSKFPNRLEDLDRARAAC